MISILQNASALVPVNYITTTATPTYVRGADGFLKHTGTTLPTGAEIMVSNQTVDANSGRTIGQLPTGVIVFTDKLVPATRTLQEVEVRSTRLWGWLGWVALAGSVIGYGVYRYKKSKRKGK